MTQAYLYQMEPVFDMAEERAVAECIRSGWVTEAKLTAAFEQEFATFVGVEYAVAVPSCTVAMALSLIALGVGPKDEVIVPNLTFVATANAVSLAGATPIFVDIHPKSFGLDPDKMSLAITAKTKAVLPVWFNGHDPNIREIIRVANKYGLPVVEDGACALGSRSLGKHAGTFGQLGCFSFNTTKIITTGTGGMVVTNDPVLFEKIRRLKNHGRTDRRDFHPVVGFNFYFSDLLAALGLAQMEKLPARIQWKQQLCKWYYDRLQGVDGITINEPMEGICLWYPDVFVAERQSLKDFLETRNIQTRTYYPPINTQLCYYTDQDFENSAIASRTGLWLPAAAYVNERTVDRICYEITKWTQLSRV